MIKKTFYNLPQAKKDRIMNAIKKEFNRVPLDKISINSIIKQAGISRGSFYQYFDDKGDLYDIIADEFSGMLKILCATYLTKNKGDFFATFDDIIYFTFEKIENKDMNKHLKDFLPGVSVNAKAVIDRVCVKSSDYYNIFLDNVDFSKLHLETKDELKYLFEIVVMIIRDALFSYAIAKLPVEKVLLDYRNKIKILRRGCEKQSASANSFNSPNGI